MLGYVQIGLPFTIEFDINRTYYSSANHFSIRLYNLAENTRSKLRKDQISFQYSTINDFRLVMLSAGYGTSLTQILKGYITRGFSVREGNNMITEVSGDDSGLAFANGVSDREYSANTSRDNIMQDLISTLPGTTKGCISSSVLVGDISRGNSYAGNTCDILADMTGGAFFIDNGVVHVLGNNEVTDDPILVINSNSGLLGTPTYENAVVHLEMLFEPTVKVGQQAVVQSLTEKRFNGYYKVISVRHRAMISETIAGEAVTELGLVNGSWNPVSRSL